eukprot:7379588-Prymnesium_polylepis.1
MSPARSTCKNGTRPVASKNFLKCVSAVPSLPWSHSSRTRRRTRARRVSRSAAWPVPAAPCCHSSGAPAPSGPSRPHSPARRNTFASPVFCALCVVAVTAASASPAPAGGAACSALPEPNARLPAAGARPSGDLPRRGS